MSSCRSAPDLSLYLSLAVLTGWQHTFLGNASLAATLLLPSDAAVRAFLQQQASWYLQYVVQVICCAKRGRNVTVLRWWGRWRGSR